MWGEWGWGEMATSASSSRPNLCHPHVPENRLGAKLFLRDVLGYARLSPGPAITQHAMCIIPGSNGAQFGAAQLSRMQNG
jgi:hypothetical protein